MNITEHLLDTLAEECGEVAKECQKSNRFGLNDQVTMDPEGPRGTEGPMNWQKIVDELNDLLGVVDMLVSRSILPLHWQDPSKQKAKAVKVGKYMAYAAKVGQLDLDVPGDSIQLANHWNPGNKVYQNHRTGEVLQPETDLHRKMRGLTTPWTPELAEQEVLLPDVL